MGKISGKSVALVLAAASTSPFLVDVGSRDTNQIMSDQEIGFFSDICLPLTTGFEYVDQSQTRDWGIDRFQMMVSPLFEKAMKAIQAKDRTKFEAILLKAMDVFDGEKLLLFLEDCVINASDTQKIDMLDSITLSGKNYRQSWFKDLLTFVRSSSSEQIVTKCNSLLEYHFA